MHSICNLCIFKISKVQLVDETNLWKSSIFFNRDKNIKSSVYLLNFSRIRDYGVRVRKFIRC